MHARAPLSALLLLLLTFPAAAVPPADRDTLSLWPGAAPGALGDKPEDTPIVQVFLPQQPTGASIVVCPGGGYGGLANHEGPKVGEWLSSKGITAFVLRYRLGPKYHHPIELGDAQRAIRLVRANAAEWKLDPSHIGILGFSAGGHLASSAATHFDAGSPNSDDPIERASSRPDFQILIYPVITMGPGGHDGSKKNLLGPNPDPKLVELLSNEKQITKNTPPAFLVHTVEDTAVPVSNSDNYAAALKAAGVSYEYIRPDKGKHGFGMRDDWTEPCIVWLKKQKFTP
ncbi:MAG TPA: alpha/beta hydrolase [Tepidisphaeraceae bacterium]|jgi:acetyl esterase/lipase|nr:alpha/beta hydrolase [Tepidisphaeraceae bacterium]